jgi:hypothetical protein
MQDIIMNDPNYQLRLLIVHFHESIFGAHKQHIPTTMISTDNKDSSVQFSGDEVP